MSDIKDVVRLWKVLLPRHAIVEANTEQEARWSVEAMLEGAANTGATHYGVLTWSEEPIVYGPVTKDDVLCDHADEEGTVEALADYDDGGILATSRARGTDR